MCVDECSQESGWFADIGTVCAGEDRSGVGGGYVENLAAGHSFRSESHLHISTSRGGKLWIKNALYTNLKKLSSQG